MTRPRPSTDPRHLRVVRGLPPGFPTPLTGFVGREKEIDELVSRLSSTRLLSITGLGGSGKTRLAIEATRAAVDAFPDGAGWVELAPLLDGALVPHAVAAALMLHPQPGRDAVEWTVSQIGGRRILLVLDNCEHLLPACAALAHTLLERCPGLHLLATTREPLRTSGEVTWRVPSLTLPEGTGDPATLERSEAVRLFVERARSVVPAFALTDANAAAVARVCQRLDGIPLAIELAAARVRLLTPARIDERLRESFSLLSLGARDAAPRQQTLRAAIDWSYDLLSTAEQRLFARLSVFAGGFRLESAEVVCPGEGLDPGGVLDLLTSLVDRSLVMVEERAGEARCRLLETIRQYAEERLEQGSDAEPLRRRHALHYLEMVEAAAPDLLGPRQAPTMDRLEEEHDNLRAALRWLIDRGESSLAARLAGAVWRFWHTRGHLAEGRRWLAEVLALPSPDPDSDEEAWRAARAKSLQGAGVLAWGQGEYARARTYFEEALAAFEELGDGEGMAALRNNLGVIALHQADYARATELFEATLVLRRAQGNQPGIATTLNNLGATAGKQGDLARARRYYEESLALQRDYGNAQGCAISLSNLGATAYEQGDYAEAERFLEEGLELRRLLGDATGVADSLAKLGKVALRRGDHGRARRHYASSLALLRELGDRERIASGFVGIGALSLARGEDARGLRLLGAADGIRAAIGAPLTMEERADQEGLLAAARARLGDGALTALQAEGRRLTLEDAYALAEEELAGEGEESLEVPSTEARGGSAAAEAVAASDDAAAPPGARAAPSDTMPRAGQAAAVTPETPSPAGPELRILALGPLEVWRGGDLVTAAEWGSARPRELLFYLLSHPQGRTKEQIGLALWPEASPAQLRNSFHVALHHLRRALGGQDWVVYENERYRFARSAAHCAYDVDEFEALLQQAEQLRREPAASPAEVAAALEQAVLLYRGDLLEGTLFGDWILPKQDELRRRLEDALLTLGEIYLESGDAAAGAEAYRRALARDRLLERAHRGLIRCLAAQGERNRALAQYRVLETLLRDELGATPQLETRVLRDHLLQEEDL